ncbi:MAG: hypothetical protein IMZ46_20490 [Acidobacteria bacterium]|nr:hypothetical protein [Acidobacteriota bacterium]
MASADVQPFPTLAPNNACPNIVSPEDVDYLVDVLGLDGGKSESDLDDEVLAKAGALGIDVTTLSALAMAPASRVSGSTGSLPTCRRVPTLSTAQSSATSYSSILNTFPAVTSTKGPPNTRRWSETLDFSLYDRYLAQLGPSIAQPKFAKARADGDAGESTSPRLGPSKKKGNSIFGSGFKSRMLWGKRALPKSVAT